MQWRRVWFSDVSRNCLRHPNGRIYIYNMLWFEQPSHTGRTDLVNAEGNLTAENPRQDSKDPPGYAECAIYQHDKA